MPSKPKRPDRSRGDNCELQVVEVLKDQQVYKVFKDLQVIRVKKDQQVLKDLQVHKVSKV